MRSGKFQQGVSYGRSRSNSRTKNKHCYCCLFERLLQVSKKNLRGEIRRVTYASGHGCQHCGHGGHRPSTCASGFFFFFLTPLGRPPPGGFSRTGAGAGAGAAVPACSVCLYISIMYKSGEVHDDRTVLFIFLKKKKREKTKSDTQKS